MNVKIFNLEVSYDKVKAIRNISFEVASGAFITLIGSNGAGKSTTLRTISGLTKPSRGEIWIDDQQIDQMNPDAILKLGVGHVPEGRRIFQDLTVYENLMLGAFIIRDRDVIDNELQKVYKQFPRLRERQNQHASTLSGGEQQMLAIGRALMSKPSVLLLDEPSLGLAPIIVQEIGVFLRQINRQGVTIILVEQNADLALQLADYCYVLETGEIALHGNTKDLANNEHVRKAYLGI